MKKKDLIKLSGISTASMAKVCNALKVDIRDIMEVLPKESGERDGKQETSNRE